MAELRTEARFPHVPAAKGLYESFYLRTFDPGAPRGVWIRYTVHKRPGEPPKGSLWFTLFDGAADGPTASKVTLEDVGSGPDHYIHVGPSRLEPGHAAGSADGYEWDLRFDSPEPPYRHLPRDWMYRARIPRTKLLTPYPGARFDGWVAAGEERIEVAGWPGMSGHNWGTEHAERWIWMHGTGFAGRDDRTWLDAALGRIKLGPLTSPWIANAALSLDGERHQLGGAERARARARGTEVRETPTSCEFTLPGKGVIVRGTAGAERRDSVGWLYADPGGSEHHVVNCSIARMRLTVERDGQPPLELETDHGAAYELGMRERDHGVPIQPFPDG